MNGLSQEPVAGPGQISNFNDELRLGPMHAGKNERRSERVLRGGGALSGMLARASGSSRRRKSASTWIRRLAGGGTVEDRFRCKRGNGGPPVSRPRTRTSARPSTTIYGGHCAGSGRTKTRTR